MLSLSLRPYHSSTDKKAMEGQTQEKRLPQTPHPTREAGVGILVTAI